MKKVNITHVSNAHNDWLRALNFYKQEIGILKGRLTEIAAKNNAKEVNNKIEHFENQFLVQNNNIDTLKHNITENVTTIAKQLEHTGAPYVDGVLLAQHNNLREKYQAEEKSINALRHEFTDFAVEWM